MSEDVKARLYREIKLRDWGMASPYRYGLVAGELGIDIEPSVEDDSAAIVQTPPAKG